MLYEVITNKDHYVKIWNLAGNQLHSWPGLHPERLKLSQDMWALYQKYLENP